MGTLAEDLTSIKNVEDTLIANKVARFSYTDTAYTNNDANGVDTYDFNHEQNIPNPNTSILKVNSTVLDKGYRSQASSITRMLVNHFFGRVSYNLNKINDNMSALIATLRTHTGTANGFATLDANGRIPYSQLPESAIELKGYWNASTNTPTLADGTGTNGDEYIVDTAGTQDLGSGSQYFGVGDRVLYTGGVWKNISSGFIRTINNLSPNAQGERSVVLGEHQPITKKIYNAWFKRQIARKWKDLTIPSNVQVFDVVYGKGIYVACVSKTNITVTGDQYGILWSEDGINWTPVSGDISSYPIGAVKFANNIFVAGGISSSRQADLWWSEDGKNWTLATTTNSNFSIIQIGVGDATGYIPSPMSLQEGSKFPKGLILYDNDKELWLIYARQKPSSGTTIYYRPFWSEDGKTWTETAITDTVQTRYFDYVHGRFFILDANVLKTSDDGKNFVAVSGFTMSVVVSIRVFYVNGYYFVGDDSGVARSQDGLTFVHDTNAPVLKTKIVYADTDGLLAVNYDSDNTTGSIIWSTDGVNWSNATVIAKIISSSIAMAKAEKINGVYVLYTPSSGAYGAVYSFNLAFWLPCNYNIPQGFSILMFSSNIQKENNIIFQQVHIKEDSETAREYYLLYASYDGINFEPIYRFSNSARGISKANNKLFYSPAISQFCMSDPDTPITEDWEDLGDTPIV